MPDRPPRSRPSTARSRGPGSASTSTHDFEPLYVVHADKKPAGQQAQAACSKDADELLLATDEDREGEAIAWHLLEELKPKVPVAAGWSSTRSRRRRSPRAVANPRDLDQGLVDAYQTRRVLDRLYGYEVSPVLWKKVMPRLSAGRVQSVATRLVVDRERERIAFRPAGYWDLEAEFADRRARGRPGRHLVPRDRWSRSTAAGSPRAATSPRPASCATPTCCTSGTSDEHGSGGRCTWRDGGCGRPGRPARRRRVRCQVGRAQALPALAVRAVQHHHAAAGGLAQARLLRQAHDVGGAAAVRERPHHLYADRLDRRCPRPRSTRPARQAARALRRGVRARTPRASTPAR